MNIYQTVQIFNRHLAGFEDSMWKYIHLIKLLVAKNEKDAFNVTRYRQTLSVIYPSRGRENYEQMELEMIAYTKNHITKESFLEHIEHMLLNRIEPNQRIVKILQIYDIASFLNKIKYF
jgi:hypothetical protein